jgi:hypothetical protein
MPTTSKAAHLDKQKRQPGVAENSREQQGSARPEAETRAWAAANKSHGGGKTIGSGRKVPSGPVGGSGRKTNLSRSS